MSESLIKKNYLHYIDEIIKNKKVSHAYLIEVDNYNQDLVYVFDFIKMIICNLSYDELQNTSNKIINLIDNNNYPDIRVISSDTSIIKKSQMIDLQKEYSNKSLYSDKRFYIIKEAEKLNASSANTILKFLEEPEDGIIAILLTDNRYHVLDTILSRCQILSLKENEFDFSYSDEFADFLDCVLNPNNFFINYKNIFNNIIPDKNIAKEMLTDSENIIINYLNSLSLNVNFNEDLKYLFKNKSEEKLIYIISVIEEEIQKLSFNVNYKLWLDGLFCRLIGG